MENMITPEEYKQMVRNTPLAFPLKIIIFSGVLLVFLCVIEIWL